MLLDSQGGGHPLPMVPIFLGAVAANTTSCRVAGSFLGKFLHDFGFLYWEMRQSVRGINDSAQIDLIWRECISCMHTDISHKTHYAPMAIMRIYILVGRHGRRL